MVWGQNSALIFYTLHFLWNFSPKPRPREKEPSQSWPTKLGSPFIARVEFPGESLRQVLIYLPNCAVAMRKKSELRQHREHGRKQPKSIKIHQMGFKAYHFVFQCAIRSKSTEIPNVQKFLNCGGFRYVFIVLRDVVQKQIVAIEFCKPARSTQKNICSEDFWSIFLRMVFWLKIPQKFTIATCRGFHGWNHISQHDPSYVFMTNL